MYVKTRRPRSIYRVFLALCKNFGDERGCFQSFTTLYLSVSSTDLYLRYFSTSLACGMGIPASECPCKHCRRLLSDVDTSQGLVLGSKRDEGIIVTRLFTPKREISGQKSLKPFEFAIDLKEYKWLA